MNIGAVGNSGNSFVGAAANGRQAQQNNNNDRYASQIQYLQQQIEGIRNNERMDPLQKQQLLDQYNQQIQDLKAQQLQEAVENAVVDSSSPKASGAPLPAENEARKNDQLVITKQAQNALYQAQSSQELSRTLSGVRRQKENERRWAAAENFIKKPDKATAAKRADEIGAIDKINIRQAAKSATALHEAAAPAAEKLSPEEDGRTTGTGRMEPGQFLNDEA